MFSSVCVSYCKGGGPGGEGVSGPVLQQLPTIPHLDTAIQGQQLQGRGDRIVTKCPST